MLDQTFLFSDFFKVITLAFLEIVLSFDNAVVISIIIAGLSKHLRRKALYFGYLTSFLFRLTALFLLSYVLEYKWLQVLGAFYLFYLSLRFFMKKKEKERAEADQVSLWKAILKIEILDLIFAFDSIIAGIGFISTGTEGPMRSKLWIVYIGGMIGILAIRFAADLLGRLMHLFPNMEKTAHVMVGLIAFKILYERFGSPPYFELIFWTLFFLLFLLGFKKRHG